VALTPPISWNSWNYFADKVTDKDIRAAADQLVSTGIKDVKCSYLTGLPSVKRPGPKWAAIKAAQKSR
jgi:hypothetical protein